MNDPNPAPSLAPAGPLDRLAGAALAVAGAALLGLVLVQGWQVFARYVLNDSPSWSEPVTLLLLSTAMSLAAASAVHSGNHFAFALLAQRAPAGLRRLLRAVSQLVMVGVGLTLATGASRLFIDGLGIAMAGAPLPQGGVFAPLALGGGLMTLFAAQQLWSTLSARPEAD